MNAIAVVCNRWELPCEFLQLFYAGLLSALRDKVDKRHLQGWREGVKETCWPKDRRNQGKQRSMHNIHGCICSTICYQSCKCHLATDLTISHEVAINSPLSCDQHNQSGQQPGQRQQPHLLQLFHPYCHFLHPHSPPRTGRATTWILISQHPELRHHSPNNTTQSWKADVFHVNPS